MLKKLLASSATALLLSSGSVYAQLGQNLFIGNAKALALGNAVTADPPGIDAIHFNPAGLVKLEGTKQHLKFILGNADISAEFIADENYQALTAATGSEDPTANSKSEIENFAVFLPGLGITEIPVIAAPLGGLSYQPPGADVTFATAAYAPLILGYTRSDDDPGVFYGRELGLSRITYLSPTVGWRITETLSVGAGIGLSYMGVGLNLDYRAANYFIGAAESLTNSYCSAIQSAIDSAFNGICGSDVSISPFERVFTLEVELEESFSPTFNFGILWQPTPWFSWGLVYQSEAADTLEGDLLVDLNPELVNFIGAIAGPGQDLNLLLRGLFPSVNKELFIDNGRIKRTGHIDITMPQHIATGISLRVLPSLKINLDYKWTETSVWEDLDFRFDQPIETLGILSFIDGVSGDGLTVPREYEDASNFALGIEYQYNDQLALRLGYEPRDSGIPDDKRDFLLPLGDFDLYGLGFEYRMGPEQIVDFAIGYGHIDEYVPTGASTNGNDLRPDNFVYNPSAGQDVHYETEFLLIEISYLSNF